MLPEIGASELLLIAVVALIVVGPKDLPALLRKLGQAMAKVRGMAAEFRASFDEMARQSELDELRKEVEAMRRGQLVDLGQAEASATMREIHQGLDDPTWNTPAQPVTPAPEAAPAKPARKRATRAKPEAVAAPPAPRKPRARKPKTTPSADA
jgi:sec-independent protein translocase protein TatB